MKAIAYLRVSTEQQENKRQIDDITKYVKYNNLELLEVFEEKESGTKIVREALTAMLNYAFTNEVDFVIVSEVSRLGRTSEVLNTIRDLHKHRVGLISIQNDLKSLNDDKSINANSQLTIGILTALNQYELSTIKYRSKSGIRRAFKEGKTLGSRSIPYGYKTEKGGYLRIDEENSKRVIELFTKYLNGMGTLMLAKHFNKEGIKAQRSEKWSDTAIVKILRNPIYIGKRRFRIDNKEKGTKPEFDHNELPQLRLIDDDTFNQVQQKLTDNQHKGTINTYNYIIPSSKMICGCCGKTYRPHRNAKGTDERFVCASRRLGNDCGNYGISILKLEKAIQLLVLRHFSDTLSKKLDNNIIKEEIKEIGEINEKLIIEIESLTKSTSNLIKDKYKYNMPDEAFKIALNALNKELSDKNTTLEVSKSKLNDLQQTYLNIKDLKKLEQQVMNNNHIPSDKVNLIIKRLTIIKEDFNWKDVFSRKDDKILRIIIEAGIDRNEVMACISQRENFMMDLQTGKKISLK